MRAVGQVSIKKKTERKKKYKKGLKKNKVYLFPAISQFLFDWYPDDRPRLLLDDLLNLVVDLF